jgi:transcriptional regulator with XRE-family HTH domain
MRGRKPGLPRQPLSELYGHVGQTIQASRTAKGFTQAELAVAIGLTRTSVTNIEAGRQSIMLHTLEAIGQALGRPGRDFFPTPEQVFADGPWYAHSGSWDATT